LLQPCRYHVLVDNLVTSLSQPCMTFFVWLTEALYF